MAQTESARLAGLVVEDDPDYAALLATILQDGGYSVRTASDGERALEATRSKRPDVITLDLQMPRKSGVLFYRQLKSDPELRKIPVIVVTGITRDDRTMETLVHSLLEVEHPPVPSAFLEKPVDAVRRPSLPRARGAAVRPRSWSSTSPSFTRAALPSNRIVRRGRPGVHNPTGLSREAEALR